MSQKIITFLHSGDCGDFIASLYSVKHLVEKNGAKAKIYLDVSGGLTCNSPEINQVMRQQTMGHGTKLSKNNVDFMMPLLLKQDYIDSVEMINGEQVKVDFNLNAFRSKFFDRESMQRTNTNLDLMHRDLFKFDLTFKDEPWLKCDKIQLNKKVAMARSTRYNSAHVYLATHESTYKDSYFIGLKFEHEVFQNAMNYSPEFYKINDALDAAQVINSVDTFYSNGTLMFWIAVALNHHNIVHELAVDLYTTYYKDNPYITYVIGGHQVK